MSVSHKGREIETVHTEDSVKLSFMIYISF